jgi:hypothetical protein
MNATTKVLALRVTAALAIAGILGAGAAAAQAPPYPAYESPMQSAAPTRADLPAAGRPDSVVPR